LKRFIIGVLVGIAAVGGIWLVWNYAFGLGYPLINPQSEPTFVVSQVWMSIYGNPSDYEPNSRTHDLDQLYLPVTVKFRGKAGEEGHVACGLFAMTKWRSAYPNYPYETVIFQLTLAKGDVYVDAGFVRIAIATAWKDGSGYWTDGEFVGNTYYLEFDLWDSDETCANMESGTYVWYDPESFVIETKTAQIEVGQAAYYEIPMYEYFVKAYGKTDVEIDGVYLVIEKTYADSSFDIEIDFTYLALA